MADQYSGEGSSTINTTMDSSDSIVEISIKTLDSQIYSFRVDKNMSVLSFKEKIANETGLPVGQQRLIFRGKVLKDEHLLSEYHVENGHTLHLVERQPAQSQNSSGTSTGETNGDNNNQANDANAGASRNRVGQISHSVVLGTFNVGDQGEGMVPDLSRVIGAVLNSIGIGNQNQAMANATGTAQSNSMSSNPGTAQGNGTEGIRVNVGGQNQAGNQPQSGQAFPRFPLPQVLQIPIATASVPIPSLNTPIPGSLTTLSEFMNRMEQTFSQTGYQPNSSPISTGDLPRVDLPSNAQGLHTPEALSIVLRQAERLLSTHAVAALSHIAGRLEQDRESTDPTVRGQIQTESMQVGLAMQHLGTLLLELGRTILTLRMGQTPAESIVNAGPAVYISPSGPNPIMVQPFPLQTSSLFSGSAPQLNPMTLGSAGIGNAPRNVNIHIHAVGTQGANGDGLQGERRSGGTGSADSGASASQPATNSDSLSSLLAEVNSQIRNLVGNMQGDNLVQSGQEDTNNQNSHVPSGSRDAEIEHCITPAVNVDGESNVSSLGCIPEQAREDAGVVSDLKDDLTCSYKDSQSSASGQKMEKDVEDHKENSPRDVEKLDGNDAAKVVPLGLGLGGLERKRRARTQLQKPLAQSADSGTTSSSTNQNQQVRTNQQVSGQPSSAVQLARDGGPLGGLGSDGQDDLASVMSQVLQSPALNGMLSGVSEQTGVGSPDALRNMLQQFTQSPQMRNVVNQIAQQVDSQDVGNMFTGMGGQGGGLDFSRMFQQMMPIVSRALGSTGPTAPQPVSAVEPQALPQYNQRNLSGCENNDQDLQDDLQSVTQKIENMSPPEDIFHSLVENSLRLSGIESGPEGLVDELCSNESLVNEYLELLRNEIGQRFQGDL
ncbi:ubiquitin-like domain-containing protein CIP73 isoform X2 [Humulus lupulus]|uniref:ubiquitin-like domain-containing protein CIP73 isoform X2 n=1 Tax=Humulus lupulus TaxID=3486 RepID=UPI002B414F8F|nr:ubiquitin-like domain-containing protein CIP73 isoform X2 [Humulus lupulus]